MSKVTARLALAGVLTLAVVAGGPAFGAVTRGARDGRTVERPYERGALAAAIFTPASTDVVGYCNARDPLVPPGGEGCVRFPVKRGDRFVSLKIEDMLPLPVLGMVLTADGEVFDFFCGETEERIAVPYGRYIEVWLMTGNCPLTYQPSLPTVGTVVATFHRH